MARTASGGVYRAPASGRATLPGVSHEPRIKFCGITHPADVEPCIAAGAWAVGAVMTPHGPRALGRESAAAVMAEVPQGVERVGVFVQPSPDQLAMAVAGCGLTRVQVHGVTVARDLAALAAAAGVPLTLAIPLEGPESIEMAERADCDLVLFDAAVPGAHGGTGVRADWSLLEQRRPVRSFALAGGLTPEVVGEAVRRVHPAVLDVSSGVEGDQVGRKDPARIAAFAAAVHEAAMEAAA